MILHNRYNAVLNCALNTSLEALHRSPAGEGQQLQYNDYDTEWNVT